MKHARHAAVLLLIAGIALAGCSTTYSVGSAPHAAKSPTTTSPGPAQTTTSPSSSQASANLAPGTWCSSARTGMGKTRDGRFDLYNDAWSNAAFRGPQMICGNSASHWLVVSTQPAGNTGVLTYPCVQRNYNGAKGYPLSTFTRMTSSYAENMHAVSGTDANATYDIWVNGLHKEVMFWVDNHGPPAEQKVAGSRVGTTTFSGATWILNYRKATPGRRAYIAFVRQGSATSGTIDLLAGLKYLERRGYLAASDVVWQVNFGWEIASTAGVPETFAVSHYSLNYAISR